MSESAWSGRITLTVMRLSIRENLSVTDDAKAAGVQIQHDRLTLCWKACGAGKAS